MNTTELHEGVNKLKVDESTKKGILEIIDLKIENDMDKFSQEVRGLKWIIGIDIAIISILISILLGIIAMK